MFEPICFFNTTQSWGGGEKWHFDLAVHFHNSGYKVLVVSHEKSELYTRISKTGIKVIRVKFSNLSFLNPFLFYKVYRIFKQEKIKTVILNLPIDLKIAGIAAKCAKVGKIIYRRGSAIPIKNSFTNRFLFKQVVTNILCNSQETKRTILKNNPKLFDASNIEVIYNGVEISPFSDFKKDKNEIIIGNLGRLAKQKAQHLLVELGKRLRHKNINFKILIAGEGKLRNELVQQIKREKLEEYVFLVGFQENTTLFLGRLDIFVLTSKWEGFGYVLAEAMAAKLPIVAFDISSNPEIVRDSETGFLVDYPNMDKLESKVLELIRDEKMRKRFGEKARAIAIAEFSLHKTLANVEDYLKRIGD